MSEIKQITQEQALEIIQTREPLGLFWHTSEHNGKTVYVGIDNSSGDAWTEEFGDVADCMSWLRGEIELDEKGERI